MPFNPSGLPTPPTCESDLARWANDLQTWLVTKLTTTHNEIDNVVVEPFNICEEIGNLSAPSCLVPATGIDTASLVFAADEDAELTPGVLPWPGSVLGNLGKSWIVYVGEAGFNASTNWTNYNVNFPIPFATADYIIVLESRNTNKYFAAVTTKTRTNFVISAASGEPENANLVLRWYALYYRQN
jgi:hypothetical protein